MKIKRKVLNTIFLLTLSVISIILLLQNRHSQEMQISILSFATIGYLIWAAAFHKIDKSLTFPIYLEYVLTASLVLILLIGVLI